MPCVHITAHSYTASAVCCGHMRHIRLRNDANVLSAYIKRLWAAGCGTYSFVVCVLALIHSFIHGAVSDLDYGTNDNNNSPNARKSRGWQMHGNENGIPKEKRKLQIRRAIRVIALTHCDVECYSTLLRSP